MARPRVVDFVAGGLAVQGQGYKLSTGTFSLKQVYICTTSPHHHLIIDRATQECKPHIITN